MTHDAAVLKAQEIASRVLAPSAGQNDKLGRFSTEAVESLGESGLLGLMLPVDVGGSGLGPRTFAAVTATLAEADASVAMVCLMHILGTATISGARPSAAQAVRPILREIGAGRHLSTCRATPCGHRRPRFGDQWGNKSDPATLSPLTENPETVRFRPGGSQAVSRAGDI
jgi:alkylation response protein AidB-like acyl-CoA dehydrogenase